MLKSTSFIFSFLISLNVFAQTTSEHIIKETICSGTDNQENSVRVVIREGYRSSRFCTSSPTICYRKHRMFNEASVSLNGNEPEVYNENNNLASLRLQSDIYHETSFTRHPHMPRRRKHITIYMLWGVPAAGQTQSTTFTLRNGNGTATNTIPVICTYNFDHTLEEIHQLHDLGLID